jgi:hypothetical protein
MENTSLRALARQLIIENHVLLVCPHCWTKEQIAKEYPDLAKYPMSDYLCKAHYEILLTRAMALTGLGLKRQSQS